MAKESRTDRWIAEAKRLRRDFLDPIENPEPEPTMPECVCVPNGVECDINTCPCDLHNL